MSVEERLREALRRPEVPAWPDETGAYDRFLRRRRRRAWRLAASAGLAVALVLGLVVAGAWPLAGDRTGAGPTAGGAGTVREPRTVRDPNQGYELTLPADWTVNEQVTSGYYALVLGWLRYDPNGSMRIGVFTTVTDPADYPGDPGTVRDRMPEGQSFVPLNRGGRRSSGRRADGIPFAVSTQGGEQHGLVQYMLAWRYHCAPAAPCPPGGRWRVLTFEAEGSGTLWPEVQRVVRRLVETVRPITNALPQGPFEPEEPGKLIDPPVVVGTGGRGDYAWRLTAGPSRGRMSEVRVELPDDGYSVELGPLRRGELNAYVVCVPWRTRSKTAGVVFGRAPSTAETVRVELAGRPAVRVPTFGSDKGFPFAFWVYVPLPLDTQVQGVTGLDRRGRRVAGAAELRHAACRA
jgi:hypothetical protein